MSTTIVDCYLQERHMIYLRQIGQRLIMKDILFLSQKSELATKADAQVIQDLLDTLKANKEGCVGMAANMLLGKYIHQKDDFFNLKIKNNAY